MSTLRNALFISTPVIATITATITSAISPALAPLAGSGHVLADCFFLICITVGHQYGSEVVAFLAKQLNNAPWAR